MSIYQPDGQLDHEAWKAERAKIAAREERRRARARGDRLPLIPAPLRVFLVGLFGAFALAWVAAYMWVVL
jgi:hypothetical protein